METIRHETQIQKASSHLGYGQLKAFFTYTTDYKFCFSLYVIGLGGFLTISYAAGSL